jgi:predicted enzyme related to lactoylglutathione lyase
MTQPAVQIERNARYTHDDFWWVDLASANPDTAVEFYPQVFGWDVSDDIGFRHCKIGDLLVTGIATLPPTTDIPGAWNAYVLVVDLDETVRSAKMHGATIDIAPRDIADIGRMAMITEPTGARMCLWQAGTRQGTDAVSQPGCFTWAELHSTDPAASATFLTNVFGWQAVLDPAMPGNKYWTLQHFDGGFVAGLTGLPDAEEKSRWDINFTVTDCDEAVAAVKQNGGSVLKAPTNLPAGRYARCADPDGAAFSVIAINPLAGIL